MFLMQNAECRVHLSDKCTMLNGPYFIKKDKEWSISNKPGQAEVSADFLFHSETIFAVVLGH